MVYTVTIAPVFIISVSANCLKYHLFLMHAERYYVEYLIARRYLESLTKLISLYRTMDTSAQSLFSGAKQNILSRQPGISLEKGFTYLSIPEKMLKADGRSPSGGPGQSLN